MEIHVSYMRGSLLRFLFIRMRLGLIFLIFRYESGCSSAFGSW